MSKPRIVLDTNILVSGLRSRRGKSFKLLSLLGSGQFDTVLSVPLVFEYEDVLAREDMGVSTEQASDVIDYLCSISIAQNIFYLWRPFLKDPKDDHVLEVAVASGCDAIITYNLKDFANIHRFGVEAMNPGSFLTNLGVS